MTNLKDKPSYKDLDNFIKEVKNGDIDPLEYIKLPAHFEYIDELARHGIYVDELVKLNDDELTYTLVLNHHAEQYYEQWKHHPSQNVRYTLALQGYYPEHFIHDPDYEIKGVVTINNPHFIPQVINEPQMLDDIIIAINRWKEFDPEIGRLVYNKAKEAGEEELDGLEYKLEAMSHQPSIIEKTMSRQQLYTSGSPLWARDYTVSQLQWLLKARINNKEPYDEQILKRLDIEPTDPKWYNKMLASVI